MRLSTEDTIELILRWHALCGLVRGGVPCDVAKEVLRVPDTEVERVLRSEDQIYRQLAAMYSTAQKNPGNKLGSLQTMIVAAFNGSEPALTWLLLYLQREGHGPPSLEERIAQIQAFMDVAKKPGDIVALDIRLDSLLEQQRLATEGKPRSVEEMTRSALTSLDEVMATKDGPEKRKAATAILNHAINVAKSEKIAETFLEAVLPRIRRYSEELVRLAELRIPVEERSEWRKEAQEQLRQLLTAMATTE